MKIWKILKEYPINKEIAMEVTSNSMAPLIVKGDTVVIKKKNINAVRVGDVICFFHERMNTLIIHRVAHRHKINGSVFLSTMGDANTSIDDYVVSEDVFFGIVVGKKLKRRTIFEIKIIFVLIQRKILRFRFLRSLLNKLFF